MKETITVMFYNGMKKQMFLHNFKNIIYGGRGIKCQKYNLRGRKPTHPQGEAAWSGPPHSRSNIPKTRPGNGMELPSFSSRAESAIHHLSEFITGIACMVQMPVD